MFLNAGQVKQLKTALERGTGVNIPTDTLVTGDVGTETAARIAGDAALQSQINTLSTMLVGGSAGQVLAKDSAADYDASWVTLSLPIASEHIDINVP
jgi:hypothetical protein